MTATTAAPATCLFCSEKAAPAGQFCLSCEEKYYALRAKEVEDLITQADKAIAQIAAIVKAQDKSAV